MGIQGKFTREHFGASMPVDAPLYQSQPIYYRDARVVSFQYETDAEAAAAMLPAPLETIEPPMAVLMLLEYPWTTVGPYDEAILWIICTYQGRLMRYVSQIAVTSDVAMAGGREGYGFPKKMAYINFVRENEILFGYVERPRGLRLCYGVMRPERPVDPSAEPSVPMIALRVIPGSDGPALAQLMGVDSDLRFEELWEGPGSCEFPARSVLDPWYRLPVKKILACRSGTFDMELKAARILENL